MSDFNKYILEKTKYKLYDGIFICLKRNLDPQYSSKWKPEDVEMYDEVVFQGPYHTKQILWPRHAEQNTSGAELHKDLKVNS